MFASIIEKMIMYNSPDIRRINHAVKVFTFAQLLSEKENCNIDINNIICISSILHDIGIHNAEQKYNSTAGNYQETEGPIVAKELLMGLNIPNTILDRVLYLIGNHHTYSKIDNIDFQILVEADFIVNIDEDKMEKNAIESIKKKIFKTKYGIDLINILYP
jgi:uncharacterized protein